MRASFIACFIVCFISACEQSTNVKQAGAMASPAIAVPVANVTPEQAVSLRGTCTLKPERVVRLKSQIGGEVKTVLAQQGKSVKRGEMLATIDVENLNLRKDRVQIELEKFAQRAELLRFQVAKAEKELAVVKEFGGTNFVNNARFGKEMAVLVERRTELKENELNQALSKLDLKTLDMQIRKAAILSPMDGVILVRAVEPGAVVGSGIESVAGSEVLFEVADPKKLLAACIMRESDATFLVSGNAATVSVEGSAKLTVVGKIGRVAPVISSNSGVSRREFLVELPESTGAQLLPGMNATVEISSDSTR